MTANCCDPVTDAKLFAPATIKLAASAVLVDADGKVLIAERPAGKLLAGKWEFPGGKLEAEETPEAAVVRELREEIGIKTCAGCLSPLTFISHSFDIFHLLMPVFICRQWEGIPQPCEGQALKWVKPSQLPKVDMLESNALVVRVIMDQI